MSLITDNACPGCETVDCHNPGCVGASYGLPNSYEIPKWSVRFVGGVLHIDDYQNMPTETIASVDIETNGKEVNEEGFKIVCIGICGNGKDAYVYFDIRPELIQYLKTLNIIAHNGKQAEIAWLESYGVTIDQLYFDTKTGYYNYDSARKNYSLKPILEDVFGVKYPTYSEVISNPDFIKLACESDPSLYISKVTKVTKKNPQGVVTNKLPKELLLDKLPKEVVAEYNACDILHTFRLWTWLRQNYTGNQQKYFENIEMPLTRLLYHAERKGVKIDTDQVRRIHNEHSKARRAAKRGIFGIAGSTFNINSPKHQLLPVLQRVVSPDLQSTGDDALIPYREHSLVSALLEYRKHQKICSTYTTPLYFNAVKDTAHRIRARFSQNTITGRLSSSDPINLQNQPPAVRSCFVAEEGYSFINADWSNIELRIPAHFSGEPALVREFSKPRGEDDVHAVTAGLIYGNSVYSLPEEEYKQRRKIAKTCNFLLTNSGTSDRLAVELQCSKEQAEELYQKFWQGYPILAAWLAKEKKRARFYGEAETWFGRTVQIPQLRLSCIEPWMCGKPFKKSTHTYACKNCFVRQEAERSAMSIRVQGTAADMCKMASLRLYREYGYIPNLLVHDELNYEEPTEKAEEVKMRVQYVMENVTKLRVPLVAEIAIGKNWKEAH